jgi:hypothetical protein
MLSKNRKYFYCLFIMYFINYCNILLHVCITANLNWCSIGKWTVYLIMKLWQMIYFYIITYYYLFYFIIHLLSILLTFTMLFNMYIIAIFNWCNWLLTIHWSCSSFCGVGGEVTCFTSDSHFLGVMDWWNVHVCVCVYVCIVSNCTDNIYRMSLWYQEYASHPKKVMEKTPWEHIWPKRKMHAHTHTHTHTQRGYW